MNFDSCVDTCNTPLFRPDSEHPAQAYAVHHYDTRDSPLVMIVNSTFTLDVYDSISAQYTTIDYTVGTRLLAVNCIKYPSL